MLTHTPCFAQAQKFLANQCVLYSLHQEFAYFLQLATCCCHYLLTSSETGGCCYWLLLYLGYAAFHCGGEFDSTERRSASELSPLQLITFNLHYYVTSWISAAFDYSLLALFCPSCILAANNSFERQNTQFQINFLYPDPD